MTYIIAYRAKDSILLASDTRLNIYNNTYLDVNQQQKREIVGYVDCAQKTFYLKNANIGIQIQGNGFFPDQGQSYSFDYFAQQIEKLTFSNSFSENCTGIFNFLNQLQGAQQLDQSVKGIMAGFEGLQSKFCYYNTYNNDFTISDTRQGSYIDSEEDTSQFGPPEPRSLLPSKQDVIRGINNRILKASKSKQWCIGGPVDILEIYPHNLYHWIQRMSNPFTGTQDELTYLIQTNIQQIGGVLYSPPLIVDFIP